MKKIFFYLLEIINMSVQPVTQRFKLSYQTKKLLSFMNVKFGFNGLGEVVFRRTYSRNNEDWKDVVIRVVEGIFSIRKEHFYRNSLNWQDRDYQEYAREMAVAMFHMTWLPPGRGLFICGTDHVYNRGSTALFNCFSRSTQFWTSEGIKSFFDFKDGDKVIIKGRSEWLPATVKNFGKQKIWHIILKVPDPWHKNSHFIFNILTTENHRWILDDGVNTVTSKLIQGDILQLSEFDDKFREKINMYTYSLQKFIVDSVSETDKTEEVWCVQEPIHQEFTLEPGILTKNCASTDTKEDLTHSAEWTMDQLMHGVGIGFSTYWNGKAEMPDKTDTEVYIIPDSREGWVESLKKLMCAYIDSPKYGKNKFPIFDYSQVRPAGMPIKGFGGVSSGPEPLKKLHKRVEEYLDTYCRGYICVEKKVEDSSEDKMEIEENVMSNGTEKRKGDFEDDTKKILKKEYTSTRLVADIFNAIGACVVAGKYIA